MKTGDINPDTGYAVTAHFKAIEGNPQVEFRLAQIDPNGNCTNGIDRIYTPWTNNATDLSKLNSWDNPKYVNVSSLLRHYTLPLTIQLHWGMPVFRVLHRRR